MKSLPEYIVNHMVEDAFRKVLPDGLDLVGEYRTLSGRRIDYVIVRGFEILAVISVKTNLEKNLPLAKQSALYEQHDVHSPWAIVTDGNFYFAHYLSEADDRFVQKENVVEIVSDIISIVKVKKKTTDKPVDDKVSNQLKNFIKELHDSFKGKFDTVESVFDILNTISNINCKLSSNGFTFSTDFENKLFVALLGEYNKDEIVRYVPFSSLFRTLNDQTVGMVSLVGMNDMSECYYADRYLVKDENLNKNNDSSLSILPAERTLLNNTYILSCNEDSMRDDLTMWRLYGDDCKGVCIKFLIDKQRLKNDKSFILAPVSYGEGVDKHIKLDFMKQLLSASVDGKKLCFDTWCYWKHFFKDFRYAIEKEVRLLYTGKGCGKRSWILTSGTDIPCTISVFNIRVLPSYSSDFPLTVNEVIVGSKCSDIEQKRMQLTELIKERERGFDKGFAVVCSSTIDNYR